MPHPALSVSLLERRWVIIFLSFKGSGKMRMDLMVCIEAESMLSLDGMTA